MEKDSRMYLRAAFQYLETQQRMILQVMVTTFALRDTIRDLGPNAEKFYAKHYQAHMQGPLKPEADETLQALSQLLTELSDTN